MITLHDVIRKPLLTEKAMVQKEKINAIVFKVHPEANKIQIAEAVKKYFNVEVKAVRTMNMNGKVKRFGKTVGRRQDWKKAIVYLKADQKLELV